MIGRVDNSKLTEFVVEKATGSHKQEVGYVTAPRYSRKKRKNSFFQRYTHSK
jgi:hypothetical protein